MKLQIPITEACRIVKDKTGKDVNLGIKSNDTINLGYKLKVKVPFLGELSKTVDCDVTIENVDNEIIYLKYTTAGIGIDMILKGIIAASPLLSTKLVIETLDRNRLKINLREIEKVHEVLEKITVNGINFINEHVEIGFELK